MEASMRMMRSLMRTGFLMLIGSALACTASPTAPDRAPVGQGVGQQARRAPAGGPDLIARCYCGYDGKNFVGWVRTENLGSESAPGSRTLVYLSTDRQLDAGDELLLDVSVPALAPGTLVNSFFEELPHDRPPELFYLLVFADADGVVAETNERNNRAAEKVWLR